MKIKKIRYYARQIKSYLLFGKRAYVHGNFQVGNPKNITIGDNCSINEGAYLLGHCRITIGNNVTLSARCMLIDTGLNLETKERQHIDSAITIEDGAWIGAGAIILPGVTIGEGSVVGAGSIVTKDVPAKVVVAGNPAKRIRAL